MSDFELLKALQKELVNTLELRKKVAVDNMYVPLNASRTKIRRLRLQIQEVMKRIERDCSECVGLHIYGETWFKEIG